MGVKYIKFHYSKRRIKFDGPVQVNDNEQLVIRLSIHMRMGKIYVLPDKIWKYKMKRKAC